MSDLWDSVVDLAFYSFYSSGKEFLHGLFRDDAIPRLMVEGGFPWILAVGALPQSPGLVFPIGVPDAHEIFLDIPERIPIKIISHDLIDVDWAPAGTLQEMVDGSYYRAMHPGLNLIFKKRLRVIPQIMPLGIVEKFLQLQVAQRGIVVFTP